MFAFINIVIVIITGKFHARTWSWLQDDASQFYLVPFSNPNGGKYSVAQGLSSRFRSKMFNGVLLVFSIRLQVSPLPPAKLSNDHPLGEALAMWPKKYHWFKRVISPEEHPLGEALTMWPNKYHWFKRVISPEEHPLREALTMWPNKYHWFKRVISPEEHPLGEALAMLPNKYHWFKRVISPEEHPLREALTMWPNKYQWFKRVISPETTDFESYLLFKLQSFLNSVSYVFFGKMYQSSNWEITFRTTKNIIDFLFLLCQI